MTLCTVWYSLCVCQALGCILYLLCFKKHPFEEGAKLQIVNGKYNIPQNDTKYTVFHQLVRKRPHEPLHNPQNYPEFLLLGALVEAVLWCRVRLFSGSMLKINPEERLSINELVNQLQEIAAARNVNPKSPITEVQPVWLKLILLMLSFFLKAKDQIPFWNHIDRPLLFCFSTPNVKLPFDWRTGLS